MEKSQREFKRGDGTGTGTYDEKRRTLHRTKDDGEGTATLREYTTELHGGVYHQNLYSKSSAIVLHVIQIAYCH